MMSPEMLGNVVGKDQVGFDPRAEKGGKPSNYIGAPNPLEHPTVPPERETVLKYMKLTCRALQAARLKKKSAHQNEVSLRDALHGKEQPRQANKPL